MQTVNEVAKSMLLGRVGQQSRAVREIETLFQGECVLVLQDGARLKAGRAYRKNLDELIGGGG